MKKFMSLRDKIENEYKNALKSKNKAEISTYRLILSGIKDLDILNRSGPNKKNTDDSDISKLLKKMIKQRSESIDVYKKNNREDLLEFEQQEVNILSAYLPKQLTEDEIKNNSSCPYFIRLYVFFVNPNVPNVWKCKIYYLSCIRWIRYYFLVTS